MLDAAPAAGIPLVDDLNDLDEPVGMAPSPVNIWQGVRWNSAFAYLDPVRDRPNLTIVGDALADRVVIDGGRVTGVRGDRTGRPGRGSRRTGSSSRPAPTARPAILLRSGIGDPDALRAIGIAPVHALPGVGENLHDHPPPTSTSPARRSCGTQMTAFGDASWMPEEQTIAKARSSRCCGGVRPPPLPRGRSVCRQPHAPGRSSCRSPA